MTFYPALGTDAGLSLEELIAHVSEVAPLHDEDLVECARLLGAAASTQTLLSQLVMILLRNGDGILEHPAASSTFYIAKSDSWALRMNIWYPSPFSDGVPDNLFDYDSLHDHAFSFATVGVAGPGYQTQTFEYDDPLLYEGKQVSLRPTGTFQLYPGSALIYRRARDVHRQIRPADVSVSLNVLLAPLGRQAVFTDTGTVRRIGERSQVRAARVLTRMAACVGNMHLPA